MEPWWRSPSDPCCPRQESELQSEQGCLPQKECCLPAESELPPERGYSLQEPGLPAQPDWLPSSELECQLPAWGCQLPEPR
jgi:hypothetical protein